MPTDSYNLFFAKTPLQLFNCIEARNRFHFNEKNILHYQYQREVDKKQIEALIQEADWYEVFTYPLVPMKRIFYPFYLKSQLNKYKNKINSAYFGAYNSIISYCINLARPLNLYIVDDGIKTLEISKMIQKKTIDKKGFFRFFKDQIFNSSREYIFQSKFFTLYHEIENYLPGQIIHNDYRIFKKELSSFHTQEIVYFIGTNLFENIIKSKLCFETELQKVLIYYKKKNQKFLYILHRYEDIAYMTNLSKKYHFDIIKFENIIETELLHQKILPKTVASFASTAVETIELIYNIKGQIMILNPKCIKNEFTLVFKNLYASFSKKEIELISL